MPRQPLLYSTSEERLRVPSARLSGEIEDDGLHRVEARRAVAPQVRAVRLAAARREHRHRRLVGVQHRVRQQFVLQRVHQRL